MPGIGRWSAFYERKIVDHMLRGVPFTPPRTIYMGLFLTNPSEGSPLGVEVVGGGYARERFRLRLPDKGRTDNVGDVLFTRAEVDWGVIKGVGVWNAKQAGELLFWTEQDPERDVRQADTFRMPEGELLIVVV